MKRRISDVERANLHELTRGQTIDLMERRQEAVVLRYIRQMGAVDDEWEAAEHDAGEQDFRTLSNSEIAHVMASELDVLESRLRRHVEQIKRRRRESESEGC